MIYDVVVIGGGPAGMMAAIGAAQKNKKVCLLEKNSTLGKKLLITGGGRCNITSSLDIDDFYSHIPKNPKFLFSAFAVLDNLKLIEMFNSIGIETKVEGRKFYSKDDKATAVLSGLNNELIKRNVKIIYDFSVEDISVQDKSWKIQGQGQYIFGDKVIFATGGASYKATGSDGYIFELLKSKGIDIKPLLPTLVRLNSNQAEIVQSQGVSIGEGKITVYRKKKKIKEIFGGIVFAHNGLGGPLALNASSYVTDKKSEEVQLLLDVVPNISKEEILRIIKEKNNKSIINKLAQILPKDLIKNFIGEFAEADINNLKAVTIEDIINRFKAFEIKLTGTGGLNESVVTRGGVSVKEVNPKTMELKKLPNVYVCGEMIDVDAETGGFNLQIAFSTGYLAGVSAIEKEV